MCKDVYTFFHLIDRKTLTVIVYYLGESRDIRVHANDENVPDKSFIL